MTWSKDTGYNWCNFAEFGVEPDKSYKCQTALKRPARHAAIGLKALRATFLPLPSMARYAFYVLLGVFLFLLLNLFFTDRICQ